MNKKSMRNIFAVIEIGSNFIRMQISQLVRNQLKHLEKLEYPVTLGHDVFYNEEIDYHNILALTEIISKFQDCLLTYPLCKCKVISCSAMRYAKNKVIVQDIFKTQQNIKIDVLEENEEKALLYFEALKCIQESDMTTGYNYLIAYIGTGSIGLAVFENGNITHTQNISTGALKMHDLLGDMRRETEEFYEIIDSYVKEVLAPLSGVVNTLDQIILTGPEIKMLARLTDAKKINDVYILNSDHLLRLNSKLQKMTIENVALQFQVLEDEAAMLYHTLFICNGLMELHPVDPNSENHTIIAPIAPDIDITKAVIRELCDASYRKTFTEFKRQNVLSCADKITERWNDILINTERLSNFACRLFDKLQHCHGMDSSLKILLKLAAKFVHAMPVLSFQSTPQAVSDFIHHIELFGMSQEEINIVSLVAGYLASPDEVEQNTMFEELQLDIQLVVRKLIAIGSIALVLNDESLCDIRITSSEKQRKIIFYAFSDTSALLAKWTFEQYSPFFQRIFGIQPVLIMKLRMLLKNGDESASNDVEMLT